MTRGSRHALREFDVDTASELLSVIVGVRKLSAPVSRIDHHALFSAGRVIGGDIVLGDVDKYRNTTHRELAHSTPSAGMAALLAVARTRTRACMHQAGMPVGLFSAHSTPSAGMAALLAVARTCICLLYTSDAADE